MKSFLTRNVSAEMISTSSGFSLIFYHVSILKILSAFELSNPKLIFARNVIYRNLKQGSY